MRFYTYMYLRQADATPYYVGKGCGDRAFKRHRRASEKFIPVPPAARIVVQYWESEAEALEMEKWYITLFGRKDLGTGILLNMTDGGDGTSGGTPWNKGMLGYMKGRKVSDETRRNMSAGQIGNVNQLGHKQSAERIAKRVAKCTGRKRSAASRERMRASRLAYVARQRALCISA